MKRMISRLTSCTDKTYLHRAPQKQWAWQQRGLTKRGVWDREGSGKAGGERVRSSTAAHRWRQDRHTRPEQTTCTMNIPGRDGWMHFLLSDQPLKMYKTYFDWYFNVSTSLFSPAPDPRDNKGRLTKFFTMAWPSSELLCPPWRPNRTRFHNSLFTVFFLRLSRNHCLILVCRESHRDAI